MKEMGRSEVMALLAKAGGGAPEERPAGHPWPTTDRHFDTAIATHHDDFASLGPTAPLLADDRPFGLERRLVRRAEALWTQLGAGAPPPASEVAALLVPPYGAHAALFTIDSAASPPVPRASFVGEQLLRESILSAGPVLPSTDPTASAAAQCAAIASSSARSGQPLFMDSESSGTGIRVAPGAAALMMRAVALPFRATDSGGPVPVVVIVSWRQMLSEADTLALQRELAAAIDWIRGQTPGAT